MPYRDHFEEIFKIPGVQAILRSFDAYIEPEPSPSATKIETATVLAVRWD